MHDSDNANEMLEVTGQVLIRCFVMGLFVLFFWLGALMLAGDIAYSVRARIVPITREQFYVINYVGGLMIKATVFILFLFPYIAIRLVIRKRSN